MHTRCLLALPLAIASCSAPEPARPLAPRESVGRAADGRQTTPINQTLTPHGTYVDLPDVRPQVIAQSHDGKWLYTAGKTSELLVLHATTGAVAARVPLPSDKQTARAQQPNEKDLRPDTDGQVSFTGLAVSPDGRAIYLSNVRGSVKVFAVGDDGKVQPSHALPLPPANAPRRAAEIPSGLGVSPDGRFVACANAGSDTVSVLDSDGKLVGTLWARSKPNDLLQASPNALCFSADGERLYVGNGTMNAIAVFDFEPDVAESKLLGLVPVGWYPTAMLFDPMRNQIAVVNVTGLTPGRPRQAGGATEFNSHQYHGSLSLVPAPTREELPRLTAQVELNLRRPTIEHAMLPPRGNQPARPIPERVGEPSCIEHVVYVIKENRTYDQVLGDMPQGNGDPGMCTFGERVTPNQHALARQFVLLDNTYCAGILSADGHQWSTAAFATDYLEKSFAGWPRSYPDGMGEDEADALSYSPAGFLWDHAIARGITLRNYGEFCEPRVRWRDPQRQGEPDFTACLRTWRDKTDDVVFASEPMVPSLLPHTATDYVGWNMQVPDQFRADFFLRELAEFERRGEFPRLVLICLPNDHTSGTKQGSRGSSVPYPEWAVTAGEEDEEAERSGQRDPRR